MNRSALSLIGVLALAQAAASPAMAQYSFTTSTIYVRHDRNATIYCAPAGLTGTVTKPGSASTAGMGTLTMTLVNYAPRAAVTTIMPTVRNGGLPTAATSEAQDVNLTIAASGGTAVVTVPIWMHPPVTGIGFYIKSCTIN